MNFIKKNSILFLLLVLAFVLCTFSIVYKRFDFTADKRYTLTESTEKVLNNINEPIHIDIYLQGDFPAKFKQLQEATTNLLDEMKQQNGEISYKLIDPIKDLPNLDTLQQMNCTPSKLNIMKDGQMTEYLIFPYAIAYYKEYYQKINLLVENSGTNEDEMLNNSIENLEYSLTNALHKITASRAKKVGFLTHHKELAPEEFYRFQEAISDNYLIEPFFPSDSTAKGLTLPDIKRMKSYDAMVIAKPRNPFTDEDKMVIDQYVMNGGKTLWMLDVVNAEMDTLYRSSKILAYPIDLNLNDLLFSYGVRINNGLVKDAKRNVPLNFVVGEVQGNPQIQPFPWMYFPLGIADTEHPITQNINPVKFEFPSSIDTLANKSVKKTILYQTSPYTATLSTPNYVSLDELQLGMSDSLIQNYYIKGSKILSILLEGKFQSAYAGRYERQEIPNFKSESEANKMIVVADGDVGKNQTLKGQPLELGQDKMTKVIYGNKGFIVNAMDYLLDDNGLISLRNRKIEMKLLDSQKVMSEKSYWQMLNTFLPVLCILILGFLCIILKKKFLR